MAIRCTQQIYDPSPRQRKFTTSAEGFISGKLPMAEDKGRMFVEYTVIAIVHMIYTMAMSYQYAIIQETTCSYVL